MNEKPIIHYPYRLIQIVDFDEQGRVVHHESERTKDYESRGEGND